MAIKPSGNLIQVMATMDLVETAPLLGCKRAQYRMHEDAGCLSKSALSV
jgi:hypothetical protein